MEAALFHPTDETTGMAILSALLDRYAVVVAGEAATEIESKIMEATHQMNQPDIVDLNQWIIAASG